MEIVRERDVVCQFRPRIQEWFEYHRFDEFPAPILPCFGRLVGHEPLKRSHGADITDPEQVILLCEGHNSWVEDWPNARKLLGL